MKACSKLNLGQCYFLVLSRKTSLNWNATKLRSLLFALRKAFLAHISLSTDFCCVYSQLCWLLHPLFGRRWDFKWTFSGPSMKIPFIVAVWTDGEFTQGCAFKLVLLFESNLCSSYLRESLGDALAVQVCAQRERWPRIPDLFLAARSRGGGGSRGFPSGWPGCSSCRAAIG